MNDLLKIKLNLKQNTPLRSICAGLNSTGPGSALLPNCSFLSIYGKPMFVVAVYLFHCGLFSNKKIFFCNFNCFLLIQIKQGNVKVYLLHWKILQFSIPQFEVYIQFDSTSLIECINFFE